MKNKSIPFMLSFLFAVSVLGSSNNYIATPVFADDAITAVGTEEDVLEDGTYIVPVVQYSSPVAAVKDSKAMTNNYPIFLSSNAILEVKDGSAELTIGVENWSYYDAFVPMKQSGTIVDDLKAFRPKFNTKFPSCLIKEENKDSLTVVDKYLSAMQSMSPGVVEESNEWYYWGDHKFGNTTEKIYDENLDVEYLTFSLEDYSSVFSFLSCTNMISGVAVDKYTNYYDFISGKLSMEKAVLLESDVSFDEEREYGLNILKGTCRGDTTTTTTHWTSVNYTGDEIASNVFDSVSVSQEDEKYVVKCHVPETYTTSGGEAISYTDFKIPDGISELGTDVFENWDVLNRYTWDEQTLGEDRCITVEYTNIYELFMGCYVFFETNESVETSDIYYCCLSLSPEVNDYHDVTLTDETTDSGIRIDTNTRYIPESMSLSVSKNQDVIAEDGRDGTTKYYNLNDAFYNSSLFSEAYWYTLNVVDETGKIGKETYKGDLCIPLPEGFNLDEWFIDVRRNDGTLLYDTTNPLFTHYINIEDGYIRWKDYNVAGDTFAFLKFSDFGEVQSIIDKDSIYKADMFWHKVGKNSDDLSLFGELSMADAGIRDTRTVYIVVKDGVKKMYFKSGMVLNSAYVGHVMCDDNADNNNSVYEDSISYTSFAMDGDEIANNFGYNGYTEWGCVTGGVLTLVDDSWLDEYNVYGIAVAAPAMSAIFGNKPYSSVKKDELTVWMSLTGVEDVTQSVTVEDIEGKLGYGYQPSALLRKIKQAEIINNIGANTVNAGTAFADAYAVYNKENATSKEIETAINALDAVTTDTVSSAKVSGYSLTAKEDFGLHLFVDLGYDAQNDANAAIKFTIGGTEQTIAVSDATFVEGKGYEFTLDVPSKAMYDEITAEIILSDGAEIIGDSNLGTYSVADYLNNYIASDDNTLDDLAKATLNYGAYAEKFFNGSTDAELADVSAITIDDVVQYKHNINVTEEGIDFVGAALTLESKTSIKLYFKVDEENLYDISDFDFTVNGNKVEPETNGDYYYITVPKLTAGELSEAQTFTVNGAEFSYSPFSYVYAALADSDAEKEADLINLVKALYLYGVEAGKII